MTVPVRINPTPNPNSIKISVSSGMAAKPVTFANAAAAAADPLAKKLFEVPGVKSVFMVANFVTITKDPAVEWEGIADRLGDIVSEHFS